MNSYNTIFRALTHAAIAAFSTPARRISFAIGLSAIIHAAILWLPHLQLPRDKVQLPPLIARLEPLPEPIVQPDEKPKPANPAIKPDGDLSAKPATNATEVLSKMEKSATERQLPKHAQLTFAVFRGAGVFRVGELRHQLDIGKDKYVLKSVKQTAGLSSLLNNSRLIQTSHGKLGEQGLKPETFKEETATGGNQSLKLTFDWARQKLHFSPGGEADLPDDAQDMLSFMYQLSQLVTGTEIVPLSISDGKHLEKYQIEIGLKEDIATPMGKLRALHLHKMHAEGEAYFEIWLGLEYRLLPVKFRQVNGAGEITEEFVISDIRATNE